MKHLRTFESFDQEMVHNNEYPSVEDMKAYVCGCGYDKMEVEEMTHSQVCSAYDTCKMEANEAKKYKGKSYKKSGLKKPHLADLNKDKKISEYEGRKGKKIQDAVQKQRQGKKLDR
jgi:hypothetical protein